MEIILGIALQHTVALDEARQWVGLLVAVLAAVIAGHLAWHATDRLIALRQRTDED